MSRKGTGLHHARKIDGEDRHGPGIRLHPPVIYAISILAGIGLNNFRPLVMPFGLHGKLYAGILLTLAVVIAGWALFGFYSARTDVRPDSPDSALITCGPYCYTRNPLYIALSLIQVTVAFWLNNLWILLLLPLSMIVITRYAIAREEQYLEKLFGQDYLDYKASVRRWL
jgi:protein-S-isoprenylcysteine O-methyltransferase Ste14